MTRLVSALVVMAVGVGACGGDGAGGGPVGSTRSPRQDNVCGILWEVQWRLGPRLRGATPDALDLGRYALASDGTFVSPAGTTCTDTIASSLTALCQPCQYRPGDCEPLVRALFSDVPAACSRCGDDVCYRDETETSCAPDCAFSCGDGMCSGVEQALTCPMDCAVACGDGQCTGGEDETTCAIDCRFAVGDGVCAPGETPENSPQDCGYSSCGDGFCQSYEGSLLCPEDCCWPRSCDPEYRRCRGAGALEVCLASGAEACPQLVTSEVCEHGCVDPDDGEARCRTCAEVVAAATLPGVTRTCVPGAAPTCAGNGVERCVPYLGSETCGYVATDACPGPCASGACLGACDDCALSWRECDGDAVRRCVNLGPACNQWKTDATACAEGCVGATHDGHCQSCLDTGCSGGEVCFGDSGCVTCTVDDCAVFTRRCSTDGLGHPVVEQCQAAADCAGWVPVQRCGEACALDAENNPQCSGGGG